MPDTTLPAFLFSQKANAIAAAGRTHYNSVRPTLRRKVANTGVFIAKVLNRLEKCFGLANHESSMRQTFVLVKYIYTLVVTKGSERAYGLDMPRKS